MNDWTCRPLTCVQSAVNKHAIDLDRAELDWQPSLFIAHSHSDRVNVKGVRAAMQHVNNITIVIILIYNNHNDHLLFVVQNTCHTSMPMNHNIVLHKWAVKNQSISNSQSTGSLARTVRCRPITAKSN